jgi:hypothetical protein
MLLWSYICLLVLPLDIFAYCAYYANTMNKDQSPTELTVAEFAEAVELSHDTVLRGLHSGKIKGRKKNPLAQKTAFLIPASELERFKKLMGGDTNGHTKSS